MTIQDALNTAVEGGYHLYGSDGMDTYYEGATNDYSAWTRKDTASSFLVPMEETFLDPHFWHALGRALGWQETCDLAITCVHEAEECQRCRGSYWMYQWHCFIQALADGNIPAAFFAQLTASPTRSGRTKHRHQTGQAHSHSSRLSLIAEDTRQSSQHICEAAARARERARAMMQMTRLARQRRRSDHVERAVWRAHCGMQWSTPERG